MAWLEISLTVDGELAEAVAEVLARYLPNGVVVETTAVGASPDDAEGYPVGPLRVYGYLPADQHLEETRRKLEEALWYLSRIRLLPQPQFRPVEEKDWSESWKQHFHPIAVGNRMMIIPAFMDVESGDRIPIRIDPGMAFGTGTHPTTQLCLEFLEESANLAGFPAMVIDLGCGSGILAVAALKLGAQHALGVDIDADAVRAAGDNARLNGVSENLELGLGSIAEIRAGNFSLHQAPLVLANILAPVLIRLLDDGLAELLTPGGHLVLSGILSEQANEVQTALVKHAFTDIAKRQMGDWVAFSARR